MQMISYSIKGTGHYFTYYLNGIISPIVHVIGKQETLNPFHDWYPGNDDRPDSTVSINENRIKDRQG